MAHTIEQIYRYPVKSMGGYTVSGTTLATNGIPGDRCWSVKDEQRNSIKGGKRFPQLMGMAARLLDEPDAQNPSPRAQITLADGTQVHTDDTEINAKLSDALGTPVSLWPLLPKEQLDHYLREPLPEDADLEASLRETFGRTADEPLPDLSAFPPELFTYESPPGTYFDAYPLLLMTRASLSAMAQHTGPQHQFDVRRFRPNILLDGDGAGFVENAWAGRTARLGGARLQLAMACPRCVMTTHGFDDLPKDPGIMRALVQANEGNLGVYASVIEPGPITVGDALILED